MALLCGTDFYGLTNDLVQMDPVKNQGHNNQWSILGILQARQDSQMLFTYLMITLQRLVPGLAISEARG